MPSDASAYDVLGIAPDANDAAIEQAYKRLIKRHHPDREGGDSARAAEVNRAYRELRRARNLKDPLELIVWPAQRRASGWALLALTGLIGAAVLLWARGSLAPRPLAEVPAKSANLGMQPLNTAEIDSAVRTAIRLARRDEMARIAESRDCHHQFRVQPTLARLDRCVAFDDAVVQLQDRDPMRDQGPFSELSVTSRIWSAASTLSADPVAIDNRLAQIRRRVEADLAPPQPPDESSD